MKRFIVEFERDSIHPKIINETNTFKVIEKEESLSIFQGYCLDKNNKYTEAPLAELGENQGLFVFAKFTNGILKIETDHLASHRLYYCSLSDRIILSNNPLFIVDYLWEHYSHPLELCSDAAYSMLSLGYLPPPQTPYENVFGFAPNTLTEIYFGNKTFQKSKAHIVATDPEDFDVYEFDKMFEDAVRRQLKVSKGSKPVLAYLSGGLDSRYVCMKISQNVEEFNTLTFGEVGCEDISIANEVSLSLCQNQINVPLVNGNYLKKIEDYHSNTGGLVNFLGAAHLDYAMKLVSHDCDLVMTGLLGDVVLGSFSGTYSPLNFVYSKRAFQNSLYAKSQLESLNEATEYIFKIKGPGAVVNGDYVISDRTNSLSPFLDPIFYNYASRIPMHLKYQQRIYFKLVEEGIINLADVKWQKSGIKPKNFILNRVFSKIKWFISGILRRLSIATPEDMNPFNKWFRTNAPLRIHYDDLFWSNLANVKEKSLRIILEEEYKSTNYRRKCNALTVVLSNKKLINAYNR